MNSLVKFLSLFLTLMTVSLYGQKGVEDGSKYGHGEDSVRCIKNLSLYREYSKHKNYAEALQYWTVVFDECPKASKNVYLDGVKIYRSFLENINDDQRKGEMCDTLMLIYDRRIQYFGEKGNVRGRQGVDLLRYRRNDDIKYVEEAYGYLKESIELRKVKSSNAALATTVSASITLYKNEKFDAGKVIEDYLKVSKILDEKLKKNPGDKNALSTKQQVDDNFIKDGPGECDKLTEYFTAEIEGKEEDIDFLTNLTTMLRVRKCMKSDLYYDAAQKLYVLAPSAESAINIAALAFDRGEYQTAIEYYAQAITLETDEVTKAEYYFNTAYAYQKLNDKPKARQFALKAAEAKEGYGEPYMLIGQLYAGSKTDCSSLSLPNSVYWVAVDKFRKAKATDPSLSEKADKAILSYSQYFPDKEKAFFLSLKEGDSYKVECWINETTKVRTN